MGILFVFSQVSSIFCLITKEKLQGQGYGTNTMHFLLKDAIEIGYKFLTFLASSDSVCYIYERFGFQKIDEFECFEYKL